MTNRGAFLLALVCLALVAADQVLELGLGIALARRFMDLLAWIAVWR